VTAPMTLDTFSLISPVLGPPWLLGYSLPVVVFAIAAPWALRRGGPRLLWLLLAALAIIAGAVLAVVGGFHRHAMGRGGVSFAGATLGTAAVAILLAILALLSYWLTRGRIGPATQVALLLAVGVGLVVVAKPVLILGVTCLLSGECI
jgi:drug/metabolite transporter (DMT)-like permease